MRKRGAPRPAEQHRDAVDRAARALAAGDAAGAAGALRELLAAARSEPGSRASGSSGADPGPGAPGGYATPPLDPRWEGEVRYLLGRALRAAGDADGAAREWQLVLGLDAASDRPPRLTAAELEAAAEAALDELPQALIDELQGAAIIIVDRPSAAMVAGGIDPRVLGLYHGVPLNRRSSMFGAPYADTIHLFSANLERVCPTREALVRHIRVTVLHETAHFFGYTERQLREGGLA